MAVRNGRPVKLCPICGRGIVMGHGLSGLNYDRHVDACPKQQMRARRAVGRAYIQRIAKTLDKDRGHCAPTMGQLGFPFEGVPKEVGG